MNAFMHYSFQAVKLLDVCHVQPGQGNPRHRNRWCHGLVYQIGGKVTYSFLSSEHVITPDPGDVLYLPQGSDYDVTFRQDSDCYCINFQLSEPLECPPFTFHSNNAVQYHKLFKETMQQKMGRHIGFSERMLSNLYAIIGLLKNECAKSYTPTAKISLIQPALDYIVAHYVDGNISITYLANLCGISDVYFRNIFRAIFDVPPLKYIHELKIDRAKELLRNTNHSVRSVAEKCGFGSDCAFSREFKRSTGLSPTEYKNQY